MHPLPYIPGRQLRVDGQVAQLGGLLVLCHFFAETGEIPLVDIDVVADPQAVKHLFRIVFAAFLVVAVVSFNFPHLPLCFVVFLVDGVLHVFTGNLEFNGQSPFPGLLLHRLDVLGAQTVPALRCLCNWSMVTRWRLALFGREAELGGGCWRGGD